jgi:hypothetical protein
MFKVKNEPDLKGFRRTNTQLWILLKVRKILPVAKTLHFLKHM